jgi:hypothetical protein
MTAYTVGAKRRAKEARKAMQAVMCEISGVTIAATQEARPRRSERDTEAMRADLARRCRMMGWPADDDHMRTVRGDPRMGTLYGRLALVGNLGKSAEGCDDAYRGLQEFDRLGRQYRRLVLGQSIPGDAETPAAGDVDAKAIASKWVLADGHLTAQGREYRDAALHVIEAGPDVWPSDVPGRVWVKAAIVGLEMARYFGLRA